MQALAIIPARGGSKGVPGKNIRPLCGKPLIAWTIEAAQRARTVARVVVSTDDEQIGAVAEQYGAEVVWRPAPLSGDDTPSEAALHHALQTLNVHRGVLAFLQCTAPLMLPADIDGTVNALRSADSAFTATGWEQFVWRRRHGIAEPLGHRKTHRPMRQQMGHLFVEVGAVYALRVRNFTRAGHRFPGTSAVYPLPAERCIEIDDATDFVLAETLLRRRLARDKRVLLPQRLEAIVIDFDGVLTDNRVHIDEDGNESVTCHRGDGWALQQFKRAGVRLLVLTNEQNPVVHRRCEKLGVPCMSTRGEKLPLLQTWLQNENIDARFVCYVGNDEPDVACMRHVGCGIAPADAYDGALQAARIVLDTPGGYGCLRELAQIAGLAGGGTS